MIYMLLTWNLNDSFDIASDDSITLPSLFCRLLHDSFYLLHWFSSEYT
jgi:hypothetical protein